jgi:hypothetical protein
MSTRIYDMREELLPEDRLQAIQEELSGFLLKEVIDRRGTFYYD